MRKIRMAIVRCGRISKHHFGSIDKHADNIELVAICDIDEVVLNTHKEQYQKTNSNALAYKIPYPKAPEICIAIVSPSNSKIEITEKIELYLAKGATEVWIAYDNPVGCKGTEDSINHLLYVFIIQYVKNITFGSDFDDEYLFILQIVSDLKLFKKIADMVLANGLLDDISDIENGT